MRTESERRGWARWTLALLAGPIVSCQGIDFDTGRAVAAEEALASLSSDLTYVNQTSGSQETFYATSPTIQVSGVTGSLRHGLISMPPVPAGLTPDHFIRSARLYFAVTSCSNVAPEVEIRRAPLGTNAATGLETRFNLPAANWLCSNDAAGAGLCESGTSGASWSDHARNPVIARRSCPNGVLGVGAEFEITGDYAATYAIGGSTALQTHPGYILTMPPGTPATSTLPSDVELRVDTEVATFVPVLPAVPPLDRGRVTHVLDAYGFMLGTVMYGGAVDEVRAAHLRGRVRALSGSSVIDLAGADVRILDRPDAPITRSRNDGAGKVGVWDLLLNGGGQVTVSFSAPGYITSQRTVDVGWNDEVVVPDVVLVPEPACVAVNGATGGLYTHPSWTVTGDGRGDRSVVAYVPPGTEARPLGAWTSGVSDFDLCWTEMTRRIAGVRDDALMPADVATGTAYTFAGEGRVRVTSPSAPIAQPYFAPIGSGATGRSTISMYLRTDTFVGGGSNLDLPVGTTVPVGSYDERRGLWGPEMDGAFVQVNAGASGCIATGGAPVTIPGAEVTAVCASASFPDNSRYMRVPIGHFSPTDWNLLGGIDFREAIDFATGDAGSCESAQDGSIVYCERRALGETVPVHGTNYSLSYNSANQAGRTEAYSVRITPGGSGTTLPGSVNLSMEVAGRVVATSTVALGATAILTWNGLDAFDRRMLGPQRADIWVEYVFNTEYLCQSPSTPGRSFQDRIAGFTVDCGAREARLRYRRTRWVGTFDDLIRGFGGWAISDHHIYDPVTRVLAMGNGELRTDVTTGWVTQSEPGFTSQWGIVSSAAPDGSLYVATGPSGTTAANRVLRFSPAGVLDSAVQINLFDDVTGLAAGPDGELYVGRSGPAGDNNGCILRMRSWTNSAAAFEPVIGSCGTASTSVPVARVPLVCEACGTPGSGPNQVAAARVHEPRNMAVSPEGILAYTDIQSSGIGYWSINFYREVAGTRLLTLFRTTGSSSDKLGPIAFDRAGRMYWSIQPGGAVSDPWLVRRLDDDADPGGSGAISDGNVVLGGGSNLVDGVRATGSSGLRLLNWVQFPIYAAEAQQFRSVAWA